MEARKNKAKKRGKDDKKRRGRVAQQRDVGRVEKEGRGSDKERNQVMAKAMKRRGVVVEVMKV